ncbi:MAG: helix-turn-helix transcriptional regulator [Lentisphaeria bacterium]|nr:helix-turn-helix transcriptional regulator [Lentisphaeria bacterium]
MFYRKSCFELQAGDGMDFYGQARLLADFFSRWTDCRMVLFDRDAGIGSKAEGLDLHCHECYEIRVPLDAAGNPAGAMELVLPGVMHHAIPLEEIRDTFSISFDPLILRYRQETSCFFTSPYEESLTAIFSGLKNGAALQPAFGEECRLLLALPFLRAQAAAEPAHGNSVELMGHYIDHYYYRSNFSIRELAQQFGYSPNYVQRCFRKVFNVTPREMLLECRMRAAVRFMQKKQYRIKELAAMCGFQDVHHFSKTFRRYYGVSPSGYAARLKKEKQN